MKGIRTLILNLFGVKIDPPRLIMECGENWVVYNDASAKICGSDTAIQGHRPYYPWNVGILTERLEKLNKRIKQLPYRSNAADQKITIEAVAIQDHVAVSLWLKGELTAEHFRRSTEKNDIIVIPGFQFGVHVLDLWIREMTYYDSYEFVVDGHPEGHRVIRDVPDALATATGEQTT